MLNFIAKLRGLFRDIDKQADVMAFYHPRHRTSADPLAVLMVTHRWTSS